MDKGIFKACVKNGSYGHSWRTLSFK
jgi:hypothetical protein